MAFFVLKRGAKEGSPSSGVGKEISSGLRGCLWKSMGTALSRNPRLQACKHQTKRNG